MNWPWLVYRQQTGNICLLKYNLSESNGKSKPTCRCDDRATWGSLEPRLRSACRRVSKGSHTSSRVAPSSWGGTSRRWDRVSDGTAPRTTRTVDIDLVLSYIYSKQAMAGLTQEWLREVSVSRLGCGVYDRSHITPCVGYFRSPGIDTR